MTLRFGTDGVRGVANAELTPEFALLLGRASARVLGRIAFLVGRDTRRSGHMLTAALTAGLTSEGADVIDLGVLPTPGVAWESASLGHPAAMISASHNPFQDNGIKLFAPGGRKLPDATEADIEAAIESLAHPGDGRPTGVAVGTFSAVSGANGYGDALIEGMQGRRLEGLRVVLDCANGAASTVAPAVVRSLGAEVTVLHDAPDGTNINDRCGSTHPESLMAAVIAGGADVGLAFDGDADRLLAVDRHGSLVDGDQIIAMCALDLRSQGRLLDDTVVVTVMSNLGFKIAMAEAGVRVIETKVGDRYVLEALEEGGFSLGGEQSGHVIFHDRATTGDGLLTGLAVLDLMVRSGRPLHELAGVMRRFPQVLRNVSGVDRSRLDGAEALWDAVRKEEAQLGGRGRVLIRPSGTEALVRVMVEAPTAEGAEAVCERLCQVVRLTLSL